MGAPEKTSSDIIECEPAEATHVRIQCDEPWKARILAARAGGHYGVWNRFGCPIIEVNQAACFLVISTRDSDVGFAESNFLEEFLADEYAENTVVTWYTGPELGKKLPKYAIQT
jgi:hypothetical protein